MERLIELVGGPGDGRILRWKHGDYPTLQIPLPGPNGMGVATYARDPSAPHRYLFVESGPA